MLVVDALRMDAPRIHVGASGILVQQGRVLMGKRNPDDDALPGLWCTPGGGVELFERLQAAVEREFAEETGIIVVANSPIGAFESINKVTGKHTILHFFRVVQADSAKPMALEGFSEVKFWTWNEIFQSEPIITNLTFAALSKCYHSLGRESF